MHFYFDTFDAKRGSTLPTPLRIHSRRLDDGRWEAWCHDLDEEETAVFTDTEVEAWNRVMARSLEIVATYIGEGAQVPPEGIVFRSYEASEPVGPIPSRSRFKRIERRINHRGWQFLHNLIGHPMLALYRPLGLRIHNYTASRMYGDDAEEYYPEDAGDVNG